MASATTTGGRAARNTAGMLSARLVVTATGLVTLPLVYDHLGGRKFGVWVLLTAILAVLAIADLGLGSAMVREVARADDSGPSLRRVRAVLGLGVGWAMLITALAAVVLVVTWPWISRLFHLGEIAGEARRATLWLLLGLLFGGVELPWRAVLEGTQRHGTAAWLGAGAALAGGLLTVLVLRAGGGLAGLAAVTAVTGVLRTGLTAAVARRLSPAYRPRLRDVRRRDLRVVTGYGLRVQATSASGAVNTELDRFVLSGVFGPATAGHFDLGARLLNLLRLPPGFALVALFPVAVAGAARSGTAWLDRFYLRTTRRLATFLGPCTAAVVVSADPLVRLWIGQPVPWAATNLAVLAPAYAVNLALGAATIVTRAEGRPGRETRYILLSVLLNVALTGPLLWLFGPLGVPVATAVAIVTASGYFLWYFHRCTRRPVAPVLRTIVRAGASSLVAAVVGGVTAPHLPDGDGRAGAALATCCQAGVTLLVAVALLIAVRLVGARLGAVRPGSAASRPDPGDPGAWGDPVYSGVRGARVDVGSTEPAPLRQIDQVGSR
ncbi:lipopolysaccharide biosynthesis protein [Solwaraspora sp. WMMB335]|uniref:lipopolysaccharide biosynthesis protein n=1 Tax=Solwaraspora sp. WMMB335 TaxID=3404118 RepID=UPI003B925D82